jgi:hypothetical protein
MFDRIYANGCSFTKAGGLDQSDIRQKYKKILNIELDNDFIQYAYPNIISKKLNVDIINEAKSGSSVNRLIRKTYEYIYKNQSTISETLFILELPTIWRDEIYSNQLNKIINVNTSIIQSDDILDEKLLKNLRLYFYEFVNIDFEYKKSMNNLLGLIYFLKHNNSNVIILDNCDFQQFLNKNNLNHNLNFAPFDNKLMHQWFAENKLTINDELGMNVDGHAGISGNEKIADIVLSYLNDNKIYPKKNNIKII